MSVLLERLATHGSVPLEGYGHQVGGHFLLMKFEDAAICKPLIKREHFFYETLPDDLKLFLPAYYGVIRVAFEEQSSGEIKMVAYPENHKASSSSQTTKIENYSLKASTGKSIHHGESSITSKGVAGGDSYINPWSKECRKNTTRKLKQFGRQLEDLHQDYMVLENLTSKFSSPSILDLKVGTRQYGDDIPEEKKKKHMKTVAESTSSTLGVRICGMQKFDASNNEYIFQDKYYGRSLDDEGFYQELRMFLHNGVCFRSDLVPSLLAMVQELRTIIKRQASYRFYSSSLLIIYDGAVIPQLASHGIQGLVAVSKELKVGLNGVVRCKEEGGCSVLTNRSIEREEHRLKLDYQSSAVPEEKEESGVPLEENTLPTAVMRNMCTCKMSELMHVNPTTPFRLQHELAHDLPPRHVEVCHCCSNAANIGTTEVAGHVEHGSQLDDSIAQGSNLLSHNHKTKPPTDSLHNQVKNGYCHDNHCLPHPHHSQLGSIDLEDARKSVDVRMIDFAHSTHSGYNDKVQYIGPDEGYVLGMTSLAACFERMIELSS